MRLKTSRYNNEDPVYYKYREMVVGIFVLIPILLIPVILAAILIRSDWARERFELNFTHQLSAQVNEGNEVFILSKRVGMVRKVELERNGFVAVQLRVDEQYRSLIRKDSRIRLKQKNMIMGDWQIEIEIGGVSSQMVEDGDTLALIPPLDLQKLSDEVISITGTINEILDTIAHGNGIVTHLLNSDSTLNNRAVETFQSVRVALRSLNTALDNSNHILTSTGIVIDSVVAKRTPKIFDGVDALIKRTDSAVVDFNALVTASDSVPVELINTLQLLNRDIEEAEILLKSAQKLRILRKKVEQVKSEKK